MINASYFGLLMWGLPTNCSNILLRRVQACLKYLKCLKCLKSSTQQASYEKKRPSERPSRKSAAAIGYFVRLYRALLQKRPRALLQKRPCKRDLATFSQSSQWRPRVAMQWLTHVLQRAYFSTLKLPKVLTMSSRSRIAVTKTSTEDAVMESNERWGAGVETHFQEIS